MPDAPSGPEVQDDDFLLRHVPGPLASGDVSSANFELRSQIQETYVSTGRESVENATDMLKKLRKVGPESRVIRARVGDIRKLGLRVIPYARPNSPAHVGIEDGTASLNDETTRIELAELFKYLEPSEYQLPTAQPTPPKKPRR